MIIHSAVSTTARQLRPVADKREAILAAALSLFNEHSFKGTAMPLVAARAGVGAGTIYRYFASKEALGNAVFRECKLAMQRHLLEQHRADATPREDFRAMWRGLWSFFQRNPEACRFLETHHHASYLDDASRALADAIFASIAEAVRRGQAAGAYRAGDPAVLISMAFGAFIGLVKEADAGRFTLTDDVVEAAEPSVWAMLSA